MLSSAQETASHRVSVPLSVRKYLCALAGSGALASFSSICSFALAFALAFALTFPLGLAAAYCVYVFPFPVALLSPLFVLLSFHISQGDPGLTGRSLFIKLLGSGVLLHFTEYILVGVLLRLPQFEVLTGLSRENLLEGDLLVRIRELIRLPRGSFRPELVE